MAGRTIELPGACPDPSVLMRAVQEGGMRPEEHLQLQQHLDGCDACEAALIALVEQQSVPQTRRSYPVAADAKATLVWEKPPKDLAPGDRIAGFEIVRLAGRGGMGEVYVATDVNLQRRVALKVISGRMGAKTRARFLDEARAMARFNHPNIVGIYAAGEHEERPWVALEYISGETLTARLRRGPLSLKETLRIGADIARGLAEAHRHGVIHRDLKPGNIMLGRDGRARVLDFGLAIYLGTEWRAAGTLDKITPFASRMMATSVGGTPRYMAPEQWAGSELRAETDCWALGAILYEMLAGQRPHPAKDLVSLMVRVTSREPPVPLTELCTVPVALEATVMRCLHDDPNQRPSAAEVLGLLEAVGDQPEPRNVSKPARPNLLAWVLPPVAAALLAVGLLGATSTKPLELRGGVIASIPTVTPPAPPKPRPAGFSKNRSSGSIFVRSPLPTGDVDDVSARPDDSPCRSHERICRPYDVPNPHDVALETHVPKARELAQRIREDVVHMGYRSHLRDGHVVLLRTGIPLTIHFMVPGERYRIDVDLFRDRMVAEAKRDSLDGDAAIGLPPGHCVAKRAIAAALDAGFPPEHTATLRLAPPRRGRHERSWKLQMGDGKVRVSLLGCRVLSKDLPGIPGDLEDPFVTR